MSQPLMIMNKWGDRQHYKKRKPPWIKLYRDLVRDRRWRLLSPHASRLLVDCWCLAAECDDKGVDAGAITLTIKEFEFEVNATVSELRPYLYELQERDWVSLKSIAPALIEVA